MERDNALTYSYSTVQRDIVCDTDTISRIGHTLDRLGVQTAMIICIA